MRATPHLNALLAACVSVMGICSTHAAEKAALDLTPTLAKVSYGPHARQILDVWKAPSEKPTPLVFFIHGGSWVNGTRGEVVRRGLADYLKAGISVVSIEYRMVPEAQAAGVKPPLQWPLSDAARALQFVRTKAGEWNIDKGRIGASGVSAGACSALWLAFHDDMADSQSSDPCARESTRALCVGVFDAQTTLDPKDIREWIPNATYGGHAFGIQKSIGADGISAFDQFLQARENLLPFIKQYSPMEWVSPDDPPICLGYATTARSAGQAQKDPTHAPTFGFKLKEKLDTAHIECFVSCPGNKTESALTPVQFLISKLNASSGKN